MFHSLFYSFIVVEKGIQINIILYYHEEIQQNTKNKILINEIYLVMKFFLCGKRFFIRLYS